jgi:predicted ATPase/DNA-binding CsgD family transcriptional regulator
MTAPAALLLPDSPPTPRTRLIGRETERAMARDLLLDEAVALLTLIGPGGVGKTRLALALAAEVQESFPDGVFFVSLAPLRDPDSVLQAIAHVLRLREAAHRSLADQMRAALDTRCLLVLDNFEHVLPAAPFVADLLAACPALKVLATSRAALRLTGEHLYPVPPLALPDAGGALPLGDLAQTEAVRLFVERARAVQPAFALRETNAAAVVEIVRRLDGLPLAVELAAAWVRVLPPAALLARLDRRLPLLPDGAHDRPSRQRTLHHTIAWSYDLLTPAEQALFRCLGVFAGGWTVAAAEIVCGAAPGQADDVLLGMRSLVDHSLVHPIEPSPDEPRFGMLETVRHFALERLEDSGQTQETYRRHALFCLGLAEWADAAAWTAEQRPRLARLAADHANVRAALAWAFEDGDVHMGVQLATAMTQFWFVRGPLSEGHDWLQRALYAVAPGEASTRRAKVLFAAGLIAARQDLPRAEALLSESLGLWQTLDDARGEAETLFFLAQVREVQDDRGDALGSLPLFARALTQFRELGHPLMRYALTSLGWVTHKCGDDAQALPLMHEAHALYEQHGDQFGLGLSLDRQARVAQDHGEWAQAVMLAAAALRSFREHGDRAEMLDALLCVATAGAVLGDTETTGRLLGAVEPLADQIGIFRDPDFMTRRGRGFAAVQRKVGKRHADALLVAGRALPFDQAVDAALALAVSLPSSIMHRRGVATNHGVAGLSAREREVLSLIAAGRTNAEIAEALTISVPTVKSHVTNILGKLDLSSRSAATAFAHREGLV